MVSQVGASHKPLEGHVVGDDREVMAEQEVLPLVAHGADDGVALQGSGRWATASISRGSQLRPFSEMQKPRKVQLLVAKRDLVLDRRRQAARSDSNTAARCCMCEVPNSLGWKQKASEFSSSNLTMASRWSSVRLSMSTKLARDRCRLSDNRSSSGKGQLSSSGP